MINVCDIGVMKPLLEGCGFHFSKAKGQNFLTAAWVPEAIVREAGVDKNAGVLEIGPGIGSLTQQLCLRAGKVCAVEVDSRLKPILQMSLADFSNVEVLWEDALKLDLPRLAEEKFSGLRPMACANLPYCITTPAIAALLEAECFSSVTVMVQREVAQRITAAPGTPEYGAFSLLCRYYAQPEELFQVGPECFQPRPKVVSSVVKLTIRENRPWLIRDKALFFQTVRASFNMRRKKLINGLASGFPELGKTGAAEVIAACGLNPDVRGETLGIEAFAALSNAIAERRASP